MTTPLIGTSEATTETPIESDPDNNTTPAPLTTPPTCEVGEAELFARLKDRCAEEQQNYQKLEAEKITNVMDSITAKINAAPKLTPEQIAERERRRQIQAKRDEERELQSRWNSLVVQIGRRYESCSLDSFESTTAAQRTVVDCLREYSSDIRSAIESARNVVLYGPPGTGKDHLLAALMRAAVLDGWSVAWRDGQTMCGELRDSIDGQRSETEVLNQLTKPSVLALSDPTPPLGSLKSEWQLGMLFRVIDRRYRDMRPTWVTINAASADEAATRISPNIIDRLTHGALVLRCNWQSYRKAGA